MFDNGKLARSASIGLNIIVGSAVLLVLSLFISSFCSGGMTGGLTRFATGILLALAMVSVGGFLGFLFAVPRSAQSEDKSRYQTNTNLEEVSDWLTKIIVGIGLVQLEPIYEFSAKLASQFGIGLGGGAIGTIFAALIGVYSIIAGFFVCYIWTRVYLTSLFRTTDPSLADRVKGLESQKRTDTDAQSAVRWELGRGKDQAHGDLDRLAKLISGASEQMKIEIFYMAQQQRQMSSYELRHLAGKDGSNCYHKLEATEPVFQALVGADTEKKFHRPRAQLAYIAKDRRVPDLKRAVELLTEAIDIRGDKKKQDWSIYELNRASCRVAMLETGDTSIQDEAIIADLQSARTAQPGLYKSYVLDAPEEPVRKWLEGKKETNADCAELLTPVI